MDPAVVAVPARMKYPPPLAALGIYSSRSLLKILLELWTECARARRSGFGWQGRGGRVGLRQCPGAFGGAGESEVDESAEVEGGCPVGAPAVAGDAEVTDAAAAAGIEGRPFSDGYMSANIPAGNSTSRCSAKNANTLPAGISSRHISRTSGPASSPGRSSCIPQP
jgi:hypothetical protein